MDLQQKYQKTMPSITKIKQYYSKLQRVCNLLTQHPTGYSTASAISKDLRIDNRLIAELERNNIIRKNSQKYFEWNPHIPVSNRLAVTMYEKTRLYYRQRHQTPKKKLNFFQRLFKYITS